MPLSSPQALLDQAHAHAAAMYGPPDVIVSHGHGAWLSTLDGRQLLDVAGGMGVTLLGHDHPDIRAAITAQVGDLLHTSNALLSPAPIQLATTLARLSGGYQSFFVNSGTEATEGALKLARAVAHERGELRPTFVACTRGFHGRTLGALSVTGQPSLQEGFAPLLPHVRFVPFGDVGALAEALDDTVAGFIVEPIQGNGGVQMPPTGYLPAAQALCKSHGALLIADEIQTGMGRTGAWFASHAAGAAPDIICLAKALGAGLPLGAVLAPRQLMRAFSKGRHGSTFGGNPVACRAALASIAAIERDDLLTRAQQIEAYLLPRLAQLPFVTSVRGRGLLFGIDPAASQMAARIRQAALDQDLLVTVAGPHVVRLFVPVIISDDDLDEALRRLAAALMQVSGQSMSRQWC